MVIECENVASSSIHKRNINDYKENEIHGTMNKEPCDSVKVERNDTSSKEFVEEERSNNQLLRNGNNSTNWWPNENESGKLDSRQRWSFGSDISIEAVENVQNRLCCSPVDEFDSTVSSENEELIVNSVDERDDLYKNYIQVSPVCSPTFKKIICSSDNKKRNKNHDADTADDELIDYSKRYTTDSSVSVVENKQIQRQRRNIVNTVPRHVPEKKSVNNRSPFGDYAETDLDQPTDYSLRYAEEDTDEEEKENCQFYCTNEQEDTVKTYYTEGTPYETPCNFSTATSMSDLLSLEGEEASYKRQFGREQKQETIEKSEKTGKDCGNRVRRKYISETPKVSTSVATKTTNSEKTPEKKLEKLCTPPQSPTELFDKEKENKVVTFNTEGTYSHETPLMFSRSSSLDSLSDFDQHSIHDDHSSVISDFSHRTSGAVSPSDLPDSPTQTVPPSPRRVKQQNTSNSPHPQRMPLKHPVRKPPAQDNQIDSKISHSEHLPRRCKLTYEKSDLVVVQGGVFEDGLVSFKAESIPRKGHSTTASSLSALTIDEDQEPSNDHELINNIMNQISEIKMSNAGGINQSPQSASYNKLDKSYQIHHNKSFNGFRNDCSQISPNKELQFINLEEDSNDHIVAYVNKDMHNNRYRTNWYKHDVKNDNRNLTNRPHSRSPVAKRSSHYNSPQKREPDEIVVPDTIRIYCTEDTPTFVSPFGSQSNLSALSMLSMSDENLSYNSNFQEEIFYEKERSNSRADAYGSEASSEFDNSDDEDKCYDDGDGDDDDDDEEDSPDSRRRIDVSPFDSQMNLANFSLLCIEEVSEEEDEEEVNDETDKSARDDSFTEDLNAYKRLSYENSDSSSVDN